MPQTNCHELPYGITCIDTGFYRPELAACYLLIEGERAAFIDTGTFYTVPGLLELLDSRGIAREAVAYVMPTHVHLDHAGGAGELMRHLPDASLVAHPRGAQHLVDPSRLEAGTISVYGEQTYRQRFGQLVPVPEERVIIAEDGLELDLNGRELVFLDTPGHARHHYSVFDAASRGFFTGDTFGLSYRELDCEAGAFVFPTTTPVHFDPAAWHASLERLLSYAPERMYLTHFGAVTDVAGLAAALHRRIDALADIARRAHDSTERHAQILKEMRTLLLDELAAMDCPLEEAEVLRLFAMDLELNAQGLGVWLDRQAARAS